MNIILQRLTTLKEDQGLTWRQFADRVGIPYRTIVSWQYHDSFPKLEDLLRIYRAFSVNLEWLVGENTTKINKNSGDIPRIVAELEKYPERLKAVKTLLNLS